MKTKEENYLEAIEYAKNIGYVQYLDREDNNLLKKINQKIRRENK